MIPEDPTIRLLLAEKLDPRSSYRKVLLDPDHTEQVFKSRPGRDQLARKIKIKINMLLLIRSLLLPPFV